MSDDLKALQKRVNILQDFANFYAATNHNGLYSRQIPEPLETDTPWVKFVLTTIDRSNFIDDYCMKKTKENLQKFNVHVEDRGAYLKGYPHLLIDLDELKTLPQEKFEAMQKKSKELSQELSNTKLKCLLPVLHDRSLVLPYKQKLEEEFAEMNKLIPESTVAVGNSEYEGKNQTQEIQK